MYRCLFWLDQGYYPATKRRSKGRIVRKNLWVPPYLPTWKRECRIEAKRLKDTLRQGVQMNGRVAKTLMAMNIEKRREVARFAGIALSLEGKPLL